MPNSLVASWTVAQQAPLSMGFPSKNAGVGHHFLLQGIFLTQKSNLCLLHWQVNSLPLSHQASPARMIQTGFIQSMAENSSINITWELAKTVNYQTPHRCAELEFLRMGPRGLFCNKLSDTYSCRQLRSSDENHAWFVFHS